MTVLLLDLDGVVVRGHPEGGRWDKNLERDLGIDPHTVQEKFFRPYFRDITLGRADLFETLARVWPELHVGTDFRTFVDYWFSMDSRLDEPVLGEVATFRGTGGKAYLATVQEHHRARHVWAMVGGHFDGMFYSAELGSRKPEAAFYHKALARLPNVMASDIVFLDDTAENVEAARKAGWRAALFKDVEDLRSLLWR